MTGTNLSLTVNPVGQTLTLSGAPATNFTSMMGDYSILASGCGQTETGTWSASLVNKLSGNFTATFTLAGSSDFHFQGTITQGPNTGGSTATLSGSMTSSDSPCFTTASLTGLISGTAVILNLVTSDGTTLGKYSGTATTDATSITGSYKFSNATDTTVLSPSCQGDGGNATVSVTPSPTT